MHTLCDEFFCKFEWYCHCGDIGDSFYFMDIVITYVDGNDPVWKGDYERYTNVPVMQKRFRDWGTLKYLLRGVEVNMPFIRNVFLVVSHKTQVPEWVNQENLKVVLHEDIIPEDYLPTFNSNTIETHLHRIEGLAEEYLYFNDDLFPVAPCEPEDFFRDGKGVLGFTRHYFAFGMYKKICRNSDRLARKVLGIRSTISFLRPQHICTAMIKSECETLYQAAREDILSSLTRTRTERNVTQYLFLVYQYLKGRMICERISSKHCSVAFATPEKVSSYILAPEKKLLCINDVRLSETKYDELRNVIHQSFEKVFPRKSRFEK